MKTIVLILPLFLLIGCGGSSSAAKQPPPPPQPSASPSEVLSSVQCENDDLRGFGLGANEAEALNAAQSALAKQIYSSVKVSEKFTQTQQVTNGQENLGSDYESKAVVEAVLLNAHDAKVLRTERGASEIGTVVCMSRANAAKGFAEKQKLVADSLELFCRSVPDNQKQKNEAWRKTQALWNEFAKMQGILDGFGAARAELFNSVSDLYSKTRDEHIEYCKVSKLHWIPEKENENSELAFAKLSQGAKIEKSACEKGVLLIYKESEIDCARKFGVYACTSKPSLSIGTCEGAEYLRLESPVEEMHKTQELALEKLKTSLKSADFWNKWEKEIKEWSPQCE